MRKKILTKVTGAVLGMALAAMVIMPAGGASVSWAAKKSNPASYSFSLAPSGSKVNYTKNVLKEASGKAHINPGYFYNTSGGRVYYRVVHHDKGSYATDYKEVTSTSSFTLAYVSTNTDNKYMLRANLEDTSRGYVATTGTWWP